MIDTTGAGDTFLGYFLAKVFAGDWMEFDRVKKAVELGTIAATLAIETMGAMSSIPKRELVEDRRSNEKHAK